MVRSLTRMSRLNYQTWWFNLTWSLIQEWQLNSTWEYCFLFVLTIENMALWRPNDIRESCGPKASRHVSYKWGKTQKLTSRRKLLPVEDRTLALCVTRSQAIAWSTAVNFFLFHEKKWQLLINWSGLNPNLQCDILCHVWFSLIIKKINKSK